jgi:hypothetical protein
MKFTMFLPSENLCIQAKLSSIVYGRSTVWFQWDMYMQPLGAYSTPFVEVLLWCPFRHLRLPRAHLLAIDGVFFKMIRVKGPKLHGQTSGVSTWVLIFFSNLPLLIGLSNSQRLPHLSCMTPTRPWHEVNASLQSDPLQLSCRQKCWCRDDTLFLYLLLYPR